jgi:hypothetical protein
MKRRSVEVFLSSVALTPLFVFACKYQQNRFTSARHIERHVVRFVAYYSCQPECLSIDCRCQWACCGDVREGFPLPPRLRDANQGQRQHEMNSFDHGRVHAVSQFIPALSAIRTFRPGSRNFWFAGNSSATRSKGLDCFSRSARFPR